MKLFGIALLLLLFSNLTEGQSSNQIFVVKFSPRDRTLSNDAKVLLDSIAIKLMVDSTSTYSLHSCLSNKKKTIRINWYRLTSIVSYLESRGIINTRMIFKWDGYPDSCDIIEIQLHSNSIPTPALKDKGKLKATSLLE